jgi:hypothetical protein
MNPKTIIELDHEDSAFVISRDGVLTLYVPSLIDENEQVSKPALFCSSIAALTEDEEFVNSCIEKFLTKHADINETS